MARDKTVCFGLVAMLVALGACQQEAAAPVSAAPSAIQQTGPAASPAAASSRIFIDPATGDARAPTASEAAAEARARSAAPAGEAALRERAPVEELPAPGGLTEVRIGERAMREERVCVQPDGTLGECKPQP